MFASSMKILTLNTNKSSTITAQSDSGTPPLSKVLNNSKPDEIGGGRAGSGLSHKANKRDQKHNKNKFVHGNGSKVEQHIIQQIQKYHNKNNNGNLYKLKNQHYCNFNSNYNNTSTVNRKKYYQQLQHHQQHQNYQQQQHNYITAVQKSINSSQANATIADNNNSNLIKNQNYNAGILSDQQNPQQRQHQLHQSNVVKNLANYSTNLTETCTCLLQQSNCDELSLPSFSLGRSPAAAAFEQTSKIDDFQSNNLCYDNRCKSSLTSLNSQISLSNEVQISGNTANACISCWKNLKKLPPHLQESAASTNSETNNTDVLASNCDTIENLAKTKSSKAFLSSYTDSQSKSSNTSTSSSVLKRKSFWKNSNASAGGAHAVGTEVNRSLSSSEYSLDSTTPSSKLPKEKQKNVSDNSCNVTTTKNVEKNTNYNCNEEKYTAKLAATAAPIQQTQISKHQIQSKCKIEMTTLFGASSGSSTSVKTSVSSNANAFIPKTITQPPKLQGDTFGARNDTNNNYNGNINQTTTTNSSSSTNTTYVKSPQNSYTLDFLHSVGVKMTDVALQSPGKQATSKICEDQAGSNSPLHNACLYTGMSTNQRQSRYMSNSNSSNNANQLQHYHHHQPSQLTIASFLHKDLLGGEKTPSGTNNGRRNVSSNSRNTHHYNDRQQQPHYAQQHQQNNTRYHHNYNAAAFQQQSVVMQHANYGAGGGYNGGYRRSGYGYTNYPNSSGEHGMGKSNTIAAQLNSRQLKYNIVNFKNSQLNKKATYASSITSNGSLSSSKSFSSNSSNISNRQLQPIVNHNSNKSSSSLNLAIETLPCKMLNGGNQRGSHRGHHNNHHHGNQHLMMNSPNVLQHQNLYNLTYVTTDASANNAVASRGCSPAPQGPAPLTLSATNCNSTKTLDQSPGHAAMLMNFNGSQLQYPRYQPSQHLAGQQHQQFHQFQQQQQPNILNKKVFVPLSLAMPPPSPSPTLNSMSHQATPHNIACCSQLDEVSTATPAPAGNDYDSDNSSSHSSTQIKCQSTNSSISSSLTTSTSMKQQQSSLQPAVAVTCTQTTPLHSPLDYCGTMSQAFSNIQLGQPPQFYGNNEEDYLQHQHVLSATSNQRSPDHFNIAVSNHSNSGYWSPSFQNNQFIYHQFCSAQAAHVPPINSSSSSCGSSSASISPRLPNDDMQSQQNYQRLQTNSESCTLLAGISPSSCSSSLNEQLSNIIVGNSSNSDSVVVLAASSSSSSNSSVSGYDVSINSMNGVHNPIRSLSQLMAHQNHRLTDPVTCQSSSSSASSLSNATASTLTSSVREENAVHTNNGCNGQLMASSQTSVATLVESSISGSQPLPPTSAQQFYAHHQSLPPPPPLPPHNLLYNNPQIHHIGALSSSSTHDSFTHTPPDRFLARAHLIEAKEAPASLIHNSKWDHLSQDIWKKFINSQQTEETFKQKMRLWRYLYVFIKNAYPRYGLYLVGSTISGFGSDSSDVDMCLVSRSASCIGPRLEALFNLTVLRDCLSKSGQFENFNLIEAKVPILRFSDRMHQLEVDLNFNNCVGIKNTHLLYCYSQLDWRLRPLVLVTKLWAQYHDINNAKNMTISSYSFVLMVIHFLQFAVNPPVLPCLHDIFPDKFPLLRSNDFGYVDMNETIGHYESKNTQAVGELFLAFLRYYSYFDYKQYAISVRTGGLLPISVCRVAKSLKNDIHQWKELCIEEPFDLTNTARSVYDSETFERVKAVFSASWCILHETLDLNSVFSTILLQSPNSIESGNSQRNTNSSIYNTTAFHEVEAVSVGVNHTVIDCEQYEKDFSISTVAEEEYKEHTPSALRCHNADNVVDTDGVCSDDESVNNRIATNNSLIAATSTAHKVPNFKDHNRTLTPCQIKKFPFSPTLSSSSTSFKTGAKNINGNNNGNNNRTVSALAS